MNTVRLLDFCTNAPMGPPTKSFIVGSVLLRKLADAREAGDKEAEERLMRTAKALQNPLAELTI